VKICFVLPRYSSKPIGGYRIVFEYANRLSLLGNDVTILFKNDTVLQNRKIPKCLKEVLAYVLTKYEPRWFPLNKGINKKSYPSSKAIYGYDVCIATAIETVETVKTQFPDAKKFYFIQDYENWIETDESVIASYKAGLKNIVISSWLKDLVEKYANEKAFLIKNPIDLSLYREIKKIEERPKHTIGLLYHAGEHKGLKYSLKALQKLKKRYPDLTVQMFGASPKPANLPEWIVYTERASFEKTVEIYNSVSVFICSSIEEGFGLTGMEAMACGAALVSSEYRGVKEYAVNGFNALLSPIKDVDSLVQNVVLLFENEDIRIKLAKNGIVSLKEFDWEKTVNMMNGFLEGNQCEGNT